MTKNSKSVEELFENVAHDICVSKLELMQAYEQAFSRDQAECRILLRVQEELREHQIFSHLWWQMLNHKFSLNVYSKRFGSRSCYVHHQYEGSFLRLEDKLEVSLLEPDVFEKFAVKVKKT